MAAVLVVVLWLELMLWFEDALCAVFVLLLLALFEAEALCEALLSLDDFACCAALDAVVFVVALLFFALLEDELAFEAELFAAADWFAALDADVAVSALFVVPLLADAPLDALRLSAAVPEVVDVLPPLDAGLLNDELPTEVDDPLVPADAVLEVVLWLDVSLLLLARFAAELWFAADDFTLLAVSALLEAEASVVA